MIRFRKTALAASFKMSQEPSFRIYDNLAFSHQKYIDAGRLNNLYQVCDVFFAVAGQHVDHRNFNHGVASGLQAH